MARHNDRAFQEKMKAQEKINMVFREHLENQFRNGITQGMYAACKVIYGKAIDDTKTAEERISEIIAFCQPPLVGAELEPGGQPQGG